MSPETFGLLHAVLVDEGVEFTLVELSRACGTSSESLVALVEEGVLSPRGHTPPEWRVPGPALQRARRAVRLANDLDLGTAGVALALELMDRIDDLRAQLQRRCGPSG
jgi:chaperone modulatory protein CbpM